MHSRCAHNYCGGIIHVKGHSVHEHPGNDIADELACWGKEGPPFCRLRRRGEECKYQLAMQLDCSNE